MKGKSKLLLVALVVSALYMIYSAWYWFGGGASSSGSGDAAQAGSAIATALVTPHLLLALLGLIFNALAFALNKSAFALTAGILYAVSMALFPMYFFFVLIQMVLCFVAFAKMRKSAQAAS